MLSPECVLQHELPFCLLTHNIVSQLAVSPLDYYATEDVYSFLYAVLSKQRQVAL